MLYLLIAIVCSSLFSVIFKLCQRHGIDTIQAILFNYVTAVVTSWGPLFWIWARGGEAPVNPLGERWLWMAAVQGFFFCYGFALMSHSTRLSGVALTNAAARASLVLPVIASWLILRQPAPAWGPVALILVALILIVMPPLGKKETTHRAWWFLLLVFFFYGVSDFSLKLVQHVVNEMHADDELLVERNLNALTGTIFFFAMLYSLIGVIGKSYRAKHTITEPAQTSLQMSAPPTWRTVGVGVALGLANLCCTSCMLRALNVLQTGTFYPLYNIGVVIMGTLFGVLFFREKLRPFQYVGLILAILSIALFFR